MIRFNEWQKSVHIFILFYNLKIFLCYLFEFAGEIVPKNNEDKEQFSSVSHQYQESYFHPLNLSGTAALLLFVF